MLEEELAAMGIHVIGPVNNLKSAIHLAETPDLDGALLDLNINGAYATEVAEKLRLRAIPFVFVTGYEPPAGLRYREVPVLRKPFTPIELRTALLSCGTDSDSRRLAAGGVQRDCKCRDETRAKGAGGGPSGSAAAARR